MYNCLAKCLLPIFISIWLAGCVSVPSHTIVPEIQIDQPRVDKTVPVVQQCHGSHATYKIKGKRYWVQTKVLPGYTESGLASWYGNYFHGRRTASGEIFDMRQLTAAHKTLPMFSLVQVTNTRNGASTLVTINDRGPFIDGRIIDLSYQAAREIGILRVGVAPVKIRIMSLPEDLAEEFPAPLFWSVGNY